MNKVINQEAPATNNRKRKVGLVVSDKMDKTVVVEIVTFKTHALYKKKYKSSKRYKAHDEENKYKIGDKVTIEECRPISRDKRWRVVEA
jgi:small subunit ribosomal protein S17